MAETVKIVIKVEGNDDIVIDSYDLEESLDSSFTIADATALKTKGDVKVLVDGVELREGETNTMKTITTSTEDYKWVTTFENRFEVITPVLYLNPNPISIDYSDTCVITPELENASLDDGEITYSVTSGAEYVDAVMDGNNYKLTSKYTGAGDISITIDAIFSFYAVGRDTVSATTTLTLISPIKYSYTTVPANSVSLDDITAESGVTVECITDSPTCEDVRVEGVSSFTFTEVSRSTTEGLKVTFNVKPLKSYLLDMSETVEIVFSNSLGAEVRIPYEVIWMGDKLKTLTVTPYSMGINVGETGSFKAMATFEIKTGELNITDDCIWTSSDETKATVDKGVVTGIAEGEVDITAGANGTFKTVQASIHPAV